MKIDSDPKVDVVQALAENVVNTRYQDIPNSTIEIAKLSIIDTLGCIIAGAKASGCTDVREQVVDWGGKQESSIILFGDKVPCPNAAFVNSTMARALDFDAVWERGLHMSAASVPTAIAVAEACEGITGKEFLCAIIAGEDLAARVHMATGDYNGFEPTGVCGSLGVAAITGKIIGLNQKQMLDAIGIAFNRSAGSFQPIVEGALAVRVMQGFASKSGIESAFLAKRGITGGKNTFEGVYGYFHLFSHDKYNSEILCDSLGFEFPGSLENTFKKYPACGGATTAIEATLAIVDEQNIVLDEVDEITVESSQHFYNTLGKPFKIGTNPQVDAQFSYQYTIANALLRRRFCVEDIMPEAIDEPEIQKIVQKVHPSANRELEKESSRGTIVSIKMKSGTVHFKKILYPRGSKQNPITREEVINKFKLCVQFAKMSKLEKEVEHIINLIDDLENVGDMSELVGHFTN